MALIPKSDYNTVLVAAANGFVVGQISCNINGARGSIKCSVQDAGGNILREAQASAHYYTAHDAQIRYNTISMPVLAGERYIVRDDETFPTINTSFTFVPY